MEREKIKIFQDLRVWQEGHKLVLTVYKATQTFPKEEVFGLSSQLRRAAISVTSNIAEGFSRSSYKDKIHFYSISLGSTTEVQNQLLIAKDIKYIEEIVFREIMNQTVVVHKILNGLIKKSKDFIHNS